MWISSCRQFAQSPYLADQAYLKYKEEEEVAVGEPPELLEKVQRQKGEDVVFGCLDGIILKKEKIQSEKIK